MTNDREKARRDFAKRLQECLDDLKIPQRGRITKVASMFNVSLTGAGKWLKGESFPDTFRMKEMSNRFKVNPNWFFTGEGEKYQSGPGVNLPPNLPPDEQALLAKYRQLNTDKKRTMQTVSDALAQPEIDKRAE